MGQEQEEAIEASFLNYYFSVINNLNVIVLVTLFLNYLLSHEKIGWSGGFLDCSWLGRGRGAGLVDGRSFGFNVSGGGRDDLHFLGLLGNDIAGDTFGGDYWGDCGVRWTGIGHEGMAHGRGGCPQLVLVLPVEVTVHVKSLTHKSIVFVVWKTCHLLHYSYLALDICIWSRQNNICAISCPWPPRQSPLKASHNQHKEDECHPCDSQRRWVCLGCWLTSWIQFHQFQWPHYTWNR